MESSASKRRKTSPTGSVAIDANMSTTPIDSPPSSRTRRSSQRPSFASPTKASLARHNPEILGRRQPAASTRDTEPGASRPGSADGEDVERALSAQLERLSETDVAEPADELNEVSQEASQSSNRRLSAPARRISGNFTKSPARKVGGGLAAKPRRSSIKPSPRPLPPPGPEDEEDILNPFVGRGLHRSPTGVIPEVVQEEPELPPTPEHPDPVVSTPPSGIHNTPSKRPRRSKSLADKIRSSPSKPPPTKQQKPRIVRRASPEPVRDAPPTYTAPEPSKRKRNVRGLESPRPDSAKEKERDALRLLVSQLEEDLQTVSTENKRIEEGRGIDPYRKDNLLSIVRSHVMPQKPPKPDQTTAFLGAALNPVSFLPFGKTSSTLPSLFLDPDSKVKGEDAQTPTSHHPVKMNATDELPYLEAFTPLSFTSQILLLEEGSSNTTLQKHVITAKSNPPGFFTTRLEMTVNTKTLAITDLTVPRIEPAAVTELVPFIDNILGQGSSNSALMKNVSIVTWALGEWYRVAMQRAQFWSDLNDELGSEEAMSSAVSSMRARKPTRRRRRQQAADSDGEEGSDDRASRASKRQRPKAEVLARLGQMSANLEVPILSSSDGVKSDLWVEWRIEFDWTGEARSKIGVQVGVPTKWHQGDERKRIAGIPDLFDKMLHGEEDPLTAVKTVVSLLAGDASA